MADINNFNVLDQFRTLHNISSDEKFKTMYEIFTPTPFHYQVEHFGYGGIGIDFNRIPLLWTSLIWAVVFSIARHFTKKSISGPISRIAGIRGVKAQKFSYQTWLWLFYVLSSIYGCIVLRDKNWVAFPMGREEGLNIIRGSPHIPSDDIRHYYSYELGFFLAEFVAIFVETKRSDFLQYVIHHIVTIFLLFFSWVSYEHRIGTYVLLIHDLSDIFLASTKLMHYLKCETMVSINFTIFTTLFIFFRLVCLPSAIYPLLLYNPQTRVSNATLWMLTLLLGGVLQSLHIFWFYSIMKMIIRLVKGVKGDIRSDDEAEDASNENTVMSKSEEGKCIRAKRGVSKEAMKSTVKKSGKSKGE